MIKRLQKISACLLLPFMIAVLVLPGLAYAKEYACIAEIPVETIVSGDLAPSGNEFEIVIETIGEDVPMPEQTTLKIKDSGKASFGPITYTVPGDYQYRVYQKPGNAANFTYDAAVYDVTVRVVNAEDGGLEATVWATRDGSDQKTDKVLFTNGYQAPVPETVKTGDTADLALWGILLVAAVAAASVLVVAKYRRRQQNIHQ